MSSVIYINARFLTQPFSGVQRVGWELAKRLIYKDSIFKIICPSKKYWLKDWSYGSFETIGTQKGILWEQIELLSYLRKKGSFLINPGNTAPLFYDKNIIINHGLSWKRVPQAFSLKFRLWYDFLIPKVLKKALLVFVVSEFCKNELMEVYKVSKEKIRVLYPGISEIFKPLNLNKKDFILYVGNLQPYKNLKNLMKGFKILRSWGFNLELWIVGIKDERVFKKEDYSFVDQKLKSFIKFLGFKEDKELVELYNQALCLVLPSLYETFGFPVVEAMACGCPVVISDIPAFREIAKEVALYINPHNPEEIAYAIKEIIDNFQLRNGLVEKGIERAKCFSWDNTVNKFLKILKEYGII
ncbi:MAG: glycosyltransferase family 4 protein [Caldimicrobium sp.]